MKTVTIPTGRDHLLPDSIAITRGVFGYNYTGFKPFDRFHAQLENNLVGLISWPGGSVAETMPDHYDLRYPDLWNGPARFGLDRLFAEAQQFRAGVSLVIPTARYVGHEDAMRDDVQGFLGRVMDGHFGAVPDRLILEIGSEYYANLGSGTAHAKDYGHLANQMVKTISDVLSDPAQNPDGLNVEIAVQVGRTAAEDTAIRAELTPDSLRNIDMLIYHRFAAYATGIDRSFGTLVGNMDDWQVAMEAAGGARPEVFMSSYNVASYTRNEALRDYIDAQAALGHAILPGSVDLEGRTDTDFENFWQHSLENRHYGTEQARALLELQAHIGSVGLGAAAAYGVDLQHPARLSLTAPDGQSYDFMGQNTLDLLAESTLGTRILDSSIQNSPKNHGIWAYGFENDDKLVTFVSWHDLPPGELRVKVDGLDSGAYKAVWAETLHAEIPEDWMARFGIPDNPEVDESPEAESYALGVREPVAATQVGDAVSVNMDQSHEILRLVFAKTDAGMADILQWEHAAPLIPQLTEEPPVPPIDPPPPDPDTTDPGTEHGDDGGFAGVLAALLLIAVFAAAH